MKLRKALTDFVRVVADEAERNPDFANRLAAALDWADSGVPGHRKSGAPGAQRPKNRRTPAILDPIEIARQGEGALRARLAALSIEQLKDIVAEFGMDAGKLVIKWKTAARIIDRIVETSMARAQKGDAFRAESKGRGKSGNPGGADAGTALPRHASSTGFSPLESDVVKEFLRSCTVPLVCEASDKLALMGTGTFFRLEGHLWLVTAAHVIPDEQSLRELAVPMRTAGQFVTLGNCILYRPNNLNLDVAIVLIQDTAFQQLVPQNWRVLEESNIKRFDPAELKYIIAGYPRETLSKKEMNWLESFTKIYTKPYSGGADDADHSMLRLTYSRSASDHSGTLARTPSLEGMSGASVWAVTNPPGELWAPDNVLKVVAVQVSFKHSDYIGAEWWTLVREVFRRWADEEGDPSSSGKQRRRPPKS